MKPLVKHKHHPKSGYQPGHTPRRSTKPGAYSAPSPRAADYDPVAPETVPEGIRWKPATPHTGKRRAYTSMFGNLYRLVRTLATGEVQYFKLKDADVAATPKEKIDAEPEHKDQVRYRIGCQCWFIETADVWYLVEVVDRVGEDRSTFGEPKRIVLKSATGWDADRKVQWPYGDLLEFPASPNNPMFARLRPLKDRAQ